MRLNLLNEDLEKTIEVLKSKYYNQPILEISKEVPEQAIEWVTKSLLRGSGVWPEDAPRFKNEFDNYSKNRGNQKYTSALKEINPEYRNILNYTLHDLEQASEIINPQIQWSQNFRELPEGAKLIKEVPPYRMVEVMTPEAAVELGSGTRWCTTSLNKYGEPEIAKKYLKDGQLYVIFKNNQKIAQYHMDEIILPNGSKRIDTQLADLQDHPMFDLKIFEFLGFTEDEIFNKVCKYLYQQNRNFISSQNRQLLFNIGKYLDQFDPIEMLQRIAKHVKYITEFLVSLETLLDTDTKISRFLVANGITQKKAKQARLMDFGAGVMNQKKTLKSDEVYIKNARLAKEIVSKCKIADGVLKYFGFGLKV